MPMVAMSPWRLSERLGSALAVSLSPNWAMRTFARFVPTSVSASILSGDSMMRWTIFALASPLSTRWFIRILSTETSAVSEPE